MTSEYILVDLAERLPENIITVLGELTVLFGRLEHMVLLSIMRLRKIKLAEAHDLYKKYSLGAKIFGKNPCKNAGENCRNYSSEPGLITFSSEVKGLNELCENINKLTSERNRFMHGLLTTVKKEHLLIYRKKINWIR